MDNFRLLVLIRGLPGSGKTTKARVLAEVGFVHFEADMYFECDGKYIFDRSKLADAHAWCQMAVEAAMFENKPVVVSNTFTMLWELDPYFKMAAANGYKVKIVEARGSYENVHGVPPEAVCKMKSRWQEIPENIA